MPVDRDHDVRFSGSSGCRRRGRDDLLLGYAAVARERTASDRYAVAVDAALDALAGLFVDVSRHGQLEFRLLGGRDQGLAENVGRESVDRGGEPEELPLRPAAPGHDFSYLGRADGQGAGLVEQDGPRLAERLDRTGALDNHSRARGAREAGHQRDRRGENQRAGGCDHDDSQPPHGIAAQRPSEPRGQQCHGKEEAGVPVGHPHHRRPLRLRLLDQPNQRGVRAVARGPVGADVERGCRRWRSR